MASETLLEKFQYGCTGVSWLIKKKLPGHACCEEHDVAYNQGGVLLVNLKLIRNLLSAYLKRMGVGLLELLNLALPGLW